MYRWDIERISQELINCEKELNKETNPKIILELSKKLNSLEQIIDYYISVNNHTKNIQTKKPSTKEVATNDLAIFQKYKTYYPYFEQMLSNLDSLVIKPKQKIPRIKINQNQIITISSEFYNQFKVEISDTFHKIKQTLPTHLQFRRLVGTGISCAETLSVYGQKESYYDIGLVRNVQDYITTIHEFGHGIANYLNPSFIFDYEKYCFVETDTLFWELISYDYLAEKLSLPNDTYLISLLYLKEYSYDADIICTKKELHSNFSLSDFKYKKIIIDYLKSHTNYDNQYIDDVLYNEISETFHYGISYLTAIELYLIYKVDPKLAIELLLKIIKAHDLSNEGYLKYVKSLGIIPGQHIKEYVDILIQRGKELGYGKRLYYQH